MSRMMVIKPQKIRLILYLVAISVCLFSSNTYGGTKMEPLYDINDATKLSPEVYDIGTNSLISLFPVPQDNSIGTNDLNNAITIMSFQKGRIKKDQYFKNALRQVGGSGTFIPVIAPDTIGFGQVRRFVFYNFRTKRHESHSIVVSLDKTIEKIAIADARLRRFIFEIEAHNPKSEDPWDYKNYLMLMDLGGKEPSMIKKIPREKGVTWSVVIDKIFLYARRNEQLRVLNMNFEAAYHPLADVIRGNKGKISFSWIHPHPYLPFAILTGGKKDEVLLSWRQDGDKSPISLFGRGTTVSQFSFSPDGKWVAFRKGGAMDIAKTYLMPVSEKYPHYLGSPILLFDKYFDEKNCGWTTNPVSFVGSYGEIYRWELTNAAHPESDKATFHDSSSTVDF